MIQCLSHISQFGNPAPKRQLSAGEASSSHQSGDIRMPIVVKDHSNSHKATVLQAQDACVVDTHFAGKRGQLPQGTLCVLCVCVCVCVCVHVCEIPLSFLFKINGVCNSDFM